LVDPDAACRISFICADLAGQKGQEPTKSGTVQFDKGCLENDPYTRKQGFGLHLGKQVDPYHNISTVSTLVATKTAGNNIGVNLNLLMWNF